MTAVNLKALVDRLTPSAERLRKIQGKAPALYDEINPSKDYVWPDVEGEIDLDSSRVVIIEAAGAVGKTEAARAMASSLRWPLIDASRMQVGDYTLTGQVFAAFGMDSSFIPSMASGNSGLIIDALDEAHLRAGTSNFEAFLENVSLFATGPLVQTPNIVLLSRPDTAEIVRAKLSELDTRYLSVALCFFSLDQSKAYIASYLRQRASSHPGKNYDIAETSPGPFRVFQDEQMVEVAQALLNRDVAELAIEWIYVREFLGYAPVLAVLAEFLAVSNPHSAQRVRVTRNLSSHRVLLEVVEQILVREQGKFQSNKAQELHSKLSPTTSWRAENDVYSPNEQAVRLIGRYLNLRLVVNLPSSVPPEIRSDYDQAADQFVADHPFLVGRNALNVVFADYLKSKAAVDESCRAALTPSPEGLILDGGPFFSKFVHEFSPHNHDGDALIAESLINRLINSHQRTLRQTQPLLFTLSQDSEVLQLSLEEEPRVEALTFTVDDPSGVLVLPDRVTRGLVVCEDSIVLGRRREQFLLGPGATILAADIVIEAEHLSVDPDLDLQRAPSVLYSRDSIQANYLLRVDTHGSGNLLVTGSGTVWPALLPYRSSGPNSADFISLREYVDLRSILRCFRQGAGSQPSVFSELLEQRVVKSNEARKVLLRQLQSVGLVRRQRSHYYLDTSALSRFGISWNALVDGSPTNAVLRFIKTLREN